MKIKSIYVLFVILLLISIKSYSQENYKPGTIITNTNDTISGYLLSVNTNPYKECKFKKSLADKAVVYSPDQLYGYRFDENGKYYISKDTPENKGFKKYFLEYLIQGKANIYFRTDKTEHFYIETERFKMLELSEPPSYLKDEYNRIIIRPSLYTGRLKYVLSDCPAIFDDIDRVKLYPTQLIKLAENYHNHLCTGEKCIIYEKKIEPVNIKWGIVAGTSYNKFYFNDDNYTNYQYNGFIGVNLEINNIVFALEQLSLKTGLNIQQFNKYNFYKKEYSVNGVDLYGNFFTDQMNFKSYAIINPITLNYSFPLNKFVPYIGAGISNMVVLNQTKDLYILGVDYNLQYGRVLSSYQFGYVGAIGLKYKFKNSHYLNLEFNYQNFQNLEVNKTLRMNTIYYSAQLGYFF